MLSASTAGCCCCPLDNDRNGVLPPPLNTENVERRVAAGTPPYHTDCKVHKRCCHWHLIHFGKPRPGFPRQAPAQVDNLLPTLTHTLPHKRAHSRVTEPSSFFLLLLLFPTFWLSAFPHRNTLTLFYFSRVCILFFFSHFFRGLANFFLFLPLRCFLYSIFSLECSSVAAWTR